MPLNTVFKTFPFCYSYISSAGLVIVKSGSHIPHLSTLLPQGNASEDYNVVVKVEIIGLGGASHDDMIIVKARLHLKKIHYS